MANFQRVKTEKIQEAPQSDFGDSSQDQGLSRKAVAIELGISETMVEIVEHQALVKMALGLGLPPPPTPKWMAGAKVASQPVNRCLACGNLGHNRRTCHLTDKLKAAGKLGALERQRHNARQGSYRK